MDLEYKVGPLSRHGRLSVIMPTSNFEEQSVQSPCTTEQGLSPRVHYHYTSASRTSLPEGIPASTATLHATHAGMPRFAPVVIPPHPFHTEVAKECHWCHGGPCMEHEECRVMLDTVQMIAAAQISAVQVCFREKSNVHFILIIIVQEQVVFAGSSYIPRDGPNGWAEEEMCLITPGILHDVDSTKSWVCRLFLMESRTEHPTDAIQRQSYRRSGYCMSMGSM